MELRSVDEGALDRPVEWICSGVPTQQPAPDRQTADLLGERGLRLFPVDPGQPAPQTRSRRLIGYVTRNGEVMRLALLLADVVDQGWDHPMVVAARWIQAGHTAEAAMPWVTAGENLPKAAETVLRKSCSPPI
ncbi:MAG: hypothetical protein DLM60_07870 [Pseudonocardiales bacterium]|nr:hypothetical protein [Actinomycetota bacterium]PZS21002.1 MAG: hypothetical protein DLM60_07870 [Pseudonocardiales bacterium]